MPLCFAHVVSTCGLPHCPQVPPKTCLLAVFFGGIGGRRVFCDDFFSSSNISSDFFSSELYSDSQRKHKSQRGVKNLLVFVVLFGVCGFFATNTKGTEKKKKRYPKNHELKLMRSLAEEQTLKGQNSATWRLGDRRWNRFLPRTKEDFSEKATSKKGGHILTKRLKLCKVLH